MYEIQNSLHSLPSGEHLTARRVTRLKFIEKESDHLKEYLNELKSAISLNKQILSELMLNPPCDSCDETQKTRMISSKLVEAQILENRSLEEKLKQTLIDREEAEGKALINEQIAAEAQRKEQELIIDYEEKFHEIRYQIERKDRVISELEGKIKLLEEDAELYRASKFSVILLPDDTILEYHNKTENYRFLMQTVARELHTARTHRDQLLEYSKYLQDELSKSQLLLANPLNRKAGGDKMFNSKRELSHDDIIVGGSMSMSLSLEASVSESEESSFEPPLPEKFKALSSPGSGKKPVPLLDLTKVRLDRNASVGTPKARSAMSSEEEKYIGEIQSLNEMLSRITEKQEELTLKLFQFSKENNELNRTNQALIKEIDISQNNINLLNDTLCNLQAKEIQKRPKHTVEIKPCSGKSMPYAVRIRRFSDKSLSDEEDKSASEEIVVNPESFYGIEY
jgi:hypothetical protein